MPLYVEPTAGSAPITSFIRAATAPVDVEVYYLASRPVIQAIQAARERGVIVRVIVDGRPYRLPHRLIETEIRRLRAAGADVRVSPPRFDAAFRFDHAKYAVSGGHVLIGTANWDYSAFHRNREYLLTSDDPALARALGAVFKADWTHTPVGDVARREAPRLVLSPGAEPRLAAIIDQPGSIVFEGEELGDDPALIEALARKGHDARVLLPAAQSARDRMNIATLRRAGVAVRRLPRQPLYLHAKMIVGARFGFIGSENVSRASLDANREVGVVIIRPAQLTVLRQTFARDWAASTKG